MLIEKQILSIADCTTLYLPALHPKHKNKMYKKRCKRNNSIRCIRKQNYLFIYVRKDLQLEDNVGLLI